MKKTASKLLYTYTAMFCTLYEYSTYEYEYKYTRIFQLNVVMFDKINVLLILMSLY